MYLQKVIGLGLLAVGVMARSILLIGVGVLLIMTKYDYVTLRYGDPRRERK